MLSFSVLSSENTDMHINCLQVYMQEYFPIKLFKKKLKESISQRNIDKYPKLI